MTLIALELSKEDKNKKKLAGETTEELLAGASKVSGLMGMEQGKEQTAQAIIAEEAAKPEKQRDAKKIAEAKAEVERSKQRQLQLAEQAKGYQGQLQGDLENAENVEGARAKGGATFGAKTWLKTAGFNVDAPGRRDVANAEATAAKLDAVKAAVDGLNRVIAGGLKITSMPPTPGGAPPLPTAVTK